ncbi:alpha/beta hydrolase fold domain-containing protein [Glaciibacter flavus]|uniref:alpha/beta hydrolase fold domain-containing protein n=1 Tax=Orlajensenia flava TaxID=2565934 RepID=UPI003B00A83A
MPPFPAALDDLIAVHRAVLQARLPENIVVAATSAEGNLAAALILRLENEQLPLTGSLVLLSVEVTSTRPATPISLAGSSNGT